MKYSIQVKRGYVERFQIRHMDLEAMIDVIAATTVDGGSFEVEITPEEENDESDG